MNVSATRRPSRLAAAIIATVTTLLVAAALVAVTHQQAGTRTQTRHAEQARTDFATRLAPARDVSTTLLAPAREDWWQLLSSLTAPLHLAGTPLPDQVRWLALTSARTGSGKSDEAVSYPALYLGFDTTELADSYTPPDECACQVLRRSNVVTLLGVTASRETEPFTDLTHVDPDDLTVATGALQVDLSAVLAHLTENSRFADAQERIASSLGIDPDRPAIWTATARTPQGPWTGQLEGFDAADVDILAIGAAVADTAVDVCSGRTCENTDPGLIELVNTFYAQDDTYAFGDPALAGLDGPSPLPDDVAVRGGLDPARWQGAFTGTGLMERTALRAIRFQVTRAGELSVGFDLS